ncbi:MAG TPA: glycosyltransferase family 4 protein [Prosthecobacter sp.]|nr:glycosyltransferase family 4 protein [Prosthecobacter sp.]
MKQPQVQAESTSPLPSNQRLLWVRVGGCFPLNSGGRIRSYYTLVHLLPRHHVHVVELHREDETEPAEGTVDYANRLEYVSFPGLPGWSRRNLPAFVWPLTRNLLASRRPFVIDRYRSSALRARVEEADQSGMYDLIVCDGLAAATAFEGWSSKRRTPAVLFQHNVEAVIWERLAKVHRNILARLYFAKHAARMRDEEPRLCRLFDGIITLSDEDASYHRTRYGLSNVLGSVPAGGSVDARGVPEAVREPPAFPKIAFLGSMDWLPNQDAVLWFVRDVLPKIHMSLPGATLLIIGRNPPPFLEQLAATHRGVELTGTVADVTEHLRRCSLMVVPLRAGSGTRIKILEAMAAGVPVVSTTVGAEGLPLHSHQDLLLADDADGIASAVLRVLTETPLRVAMAENGQRRVGEDFSWESSARQFEVLASRAVRSRFA